MSSILRRVGPADGRAAPQIDDAPETRAQTALLWTEIEGIDSNDVRARLSDDFGLFRSILKRLLDEFSEVEIPAQEKDPVALATHAGRMHKLRGSAGILGATSIQILAGEAEAACLAGEVERASRLATEVAAHLQRLKQTAAPAFMETRAGDEEEAAGSAEALEPQVLADLVHLLRRHSLSAMDRFSSLSPQLWRLLGPNSYAQVSDHMDNLQFGNAAKALEDAAR